MKAHQVVLIGAAAVVIAAALGARRAATPAAQVPAEAVAYHGAWQLYRTIAVYFGKRALVAEARYWKAVSHG